MENNTLAPKSEWIVHRAGSAPAWRYVTHRGGDPLRRAFAEKSRACRDVTPAVRAAWKAERRDVTRWPTAATRPTRLESGFIIENRRRTSHIPTDRRRGNTYIKWP
ncbi:unnamed protein product, partial [Iphiclides podalirius]